VVLIVEEEYFKVVVTVIVEVKFRDEGSEKEEADFSCS
jgi:hypothetical protein